LQWKVLALLVVVFLFTANVVQPWRRNCQAFPAGTAAAGTSKVFASLKPDADSSVLQTAGTKGTRPIMISSANGVHALQKGMDILKSGGDTLDAAVAAVTVVEDDPNDDSVGYGGLPNEEGEVELDASVMHGPTHRAGSVASVRRIKNVSRLAKAVMERTNHTMIVGDGARRFAVAEGFEEINFTLFMDYLLTYYLMGQWELANLDLHF